MNQPIIQMKNVIKEFRVGGGLAKEETFRALQGVSFDLYAGKTLALVGESGCGKSTCARLITKVYPATEGEILFNVIDARYERASTVITTNRAFKDWGKIFHDMVCAKAIIDRLVHHSDVIKIEGTSYRLKDRKTKSLAESE